MADNKFTVLIYGAGAVGLGIGSCLLRAGVSVDFVAREETVNALKGKGLARSGIFGEYSAAAESFGAFASLDELSGRSYDYVLVCTKSSDSAEAAKDILGHKSILGTDGIIVLLQNGWGNAEIFCEHFDKRGIYNGRVITGFTRPRPNEVVITVHADAIHIGSLFGAGSDRVRMLAEAISAGGIPCEKTDSIEKDLWAKMLYNCALNPLGAVLDVPYGRLAEQEWTREIMDGIVGEVFCVMDAAGFRTHQQRAEDFLKLFYSRLVPDTARHRSSTLQDIAAKKKTEIEALNGQVIALADRYGIEVPFNRTVYNMIKFIEAEGEARY